MSQDEPVSYEIDGAVAVIALDDPERSNPYTATLTERLVSALDRADADPAVRAVVLLGRGKHFCVGADLSGGGFGPVSRPGTEDDQGPDDWAEPAGRVSMRVLAMNTPVVVAVHGAAVGAGATTILSADYRLASPDARFGFVFARRGIYPEGASTWFLPRLVGLGTALDWMVSGRLVGAQEAHERGLVSAVHEDVHQAALDLARDLASSTAPVSVATIRRQLFYAMGAVAPEEIARLDSRLIATIGSSPDAMEGVSSFFERRDPQFPGRVPEDLPPWLPWLGERTAEPPTTERFRGRGA